MDSAIKALLVVLALPVLLVLVVPLVVWALLGPEDPSGPPVLVGRKGHLGRSEPAEVTVRQVHLAQ
jgi:hypothetical protein